MVRVHYTLRELLEYLKPWYDEGFGFSLFRDEWDYFEFLYHHGYKRNLSNVDDGRKYDYDINFDYDEGMISVDEVEDEYIPAPDAGTSG